MPSPITDAPLDAAQARAAVLTDTDGALVVFEGVVRNHDHDRDVTALTYSAHPDAGQVLEQVVARIAAEHGVRAFAQHRVGPLAVGDVALVAACASAHRGQAFTACEALVDRIKQEVPIWKHQRFTDGDEEWVGL